MIKVILRLYACNGAESADAYLVSQKDWDAYNCIGATSDPLGDYAWEAAVDFASSYGIYPMSEQPEDFDDEDSGGDDYSDDIDGRFELYDAEKHDGLMVNQAEWSWREL